MAPSEILLRLHDGDLVRSALGLDRYCVMAAVAVDPEIELVDLDLADALHGRTEMILKAVRRQAEENVDQPIVPNDGEQRLLVVQCICSDDFGRPVRNPNRNQIGPRKDPIERNEHKFVLRPACALDDPFHSHGLRGHDALRQPGAIAHRVNYIADVLGPRQVERLGCSGNVISVEEQLIGTLGVPLEEDTLENGLVRIAARCGRLACQLSLRPRGGAPRSRVASSFALRSYGPACRSAQPRRNVRLLRSCPSAAVRDCRVPTYRPGLRASLQAPSLPPQLRPALGEPEPSSQFGAHRATSSRETSTSRYSHEGAPS